jgi:hypothetical protein
MGCHAFKRCCLKAVSIKRLLDRQHIYAKEAFTYSQAALIVRSYLQKPSRTTLQERVERMQRMTARITAHDMDVVS